MPSGLVSREALLVCVGVARDEMKKTRKPMRPVLRSDAMRVEGRWVAIFPAASSFSHSFDPEDAQHQPPALVPHLLSSSYRLVKSNFEVTILLDLRFAESPTPNL